MAFQTKLNLIQSFAVFLGVGNELGKDDRISQHPSNLFGERPPLDFFKSLLVLLVELLLLVPVDDGVDLMDEAVFELLAPAFLIELVLRLVPYYSTILTLPVRVALVD